MSEQDGDIPEQETRGGEDIDWDRAEPGRPLPEKGDPAAGALAGYAGKHRNRGG